MPLDFRSDTVTLPTPAMRQAMFDAPLGDDVMGDDPTVNRLQDKIAAMLGKEAGLFVASGTMGNQICIRTHTEPGDEIICADKSHVFLYEGGGFAALAGVSAYCVPTDNGVMNADDVRAAIRSEGSRSHYPVTKLVCIENTCNRGGGNVYPLDQIQAIGAIARDHGLRYHLDGARIFNAAIATGTDARDIAEPFDSVSVCLSKGLGCPVGSVIVGSRPFIDRAHRFRKMFGGGMRQAGILAAAGLYALENHIERLDDDHRRAKRLAEGLSKLEGLTVDVAATETNLVYFDLTNPADNAEAFVERAKNANLLIGSMGPKTLRAVTHLGIDERAINQALSVIGTLTI